MSDPRAATPEEFGERLRNTREARGITLEFISTKTKISLLTLQALEAGAFNRLPAAVFSRMFLRQYLQLVGEEPGPWLETFDHLWRRWEASSHPFPVVAARETPVRPWARWLVGFLLVAVALTLVLWLERRERDSRPAAPPTPQALVQELAPTPPPTQKVPEEKAPPGTPVEALRLETRRPCWVEWWVEGKPELRQLVPAGQQLGLAVPPSGGELLLGDAGAVTLYFAGVQQPAAGRDGQVVRLRFPPNLPPATPTL